MGISAKPDHGWHPCSHDEALQPIPRLNASMNSAGSDKLRTRFHIGDSPAATDALMISATRLELRFAGTPGMRSGFPVRPVAVLVQPHADLPIAVFRKTHVLERDAVTMIIDVAVEDIDAGCRNRQGHPDQWAEAPHAETLKQIKPRMAERIRIVRIGLPYRADGSRCRDRSSMVSYIINTPTAGA